MNLVVILKILLSNKNAMKQTKITANEWQRRKAVNKGRSYKGRGPESILQEACVAWFRYQYPELRGMLFSVPNELGGGTNGKLLVKQGLLSGVSDLLLLHPSIGFNGLAIEMKSRIGRLSGSQIFWGVDAWENGYLYHVCRSETKFKFLVREYLGY